MTAEEFTYVDSLRARIGEPLWQELVEFVAEWLHRYENRHAVVEQGVIERWMKEMGGDEKAPAPQ